MLTEVISEASKLDSVTAFSWTTEEDEAMAH